MKASSLPILTLLFFSYFVAGVLCISYGAKDPVYPMSSVLPLGARGIEDALSKWYRVHLPTEGAPYLPTDVDKIAVGQFKSVKKLVKDKVYIEDITFFNLADVKLPSEQQAQYKYESVNDELSAERYWGELSVKHDSFAANISFTRATDGAFVNCPAVGLAKMVYENTGFGSPEVQSNQYMSYGMTVITKPFKYIGIEAWRGDPGHRQVDYFTFIDPSCGGFPNPESDMSKFTSALDKAIIPHRALVGLEMLTHLNKWLIEPNRMQLIGKTRIPGSESDVVDQEDISTFQTIVLAHNKHHWG